MKALLFVSTNSQLELTYLILACVGISIILVCIGAYIFNYGERIKERVQNFKGFGLEMSVSVITVFILVGVAMVVPMIWNSFSRTMDALNQKDQELLKENQTLTKKLDENQKTLEAALSNAMRNQVLYLALDSINDKD